MTVVLWPPIRHEGRALSTLDEAPAGSFGGAGAPPSVVSLIWLGTGDVWSALR